MSKRIEKCDKCLDLCYRKYKHEIEKIESNIWSLEVDLKYWKSLSPDKWISAFVIDKIKETEIELREQKNRYIKGDYKNE